MTEAEAKFRASQWRWAYVENIATLVAMVALILGLWWLGAGGWSLWGLLLLLNMNSSRSRDDECKCEVESKSNP